MQYVIAIDPGLLGAMCLYNLSKNTVEEVLNLPIYKKDKKTYLSGKGILDKLKQWKEFTNNVVIETQTITHRDGSKSAMTTLKNFGFIIGLLTSLELNIIEVAPITWQAKILKDVIDPGEPVKLKPTKRKSMVFAREFNPKNDGISDSICIAAYYKTLQ